MRLPPARVLEVGCAHGGFVALLGWAGFDAIGTELSPWVARFAEETFGVKVLSGRLEDHDLREGSFDVIVLNDVLEHFAHPLTFMAHCARLLSKDGFFVIQTPEYIEHLSHADLVATNDLFLKHMDRNNEEHLYLYSRRSAAVFFSRLGFAHLDFSAPVYPYDMTFVASRSPRKPTEVEARVAALAGRPVGRLVQALIDKALESKDRWWALQRLETGRPAHPPGQK